MPLFSNMNYEILSIETTKKIASLEIENLKQKKEIERLNNDYLEMKDNFRTANDEIERLNNIISKAIEYIDKHSLFEFNGNSVRDNRARMDLLNILRGEDKE